MEDRTLHILQIGSWPQVFGPIKSGSPRYTAEVLQRLSKTHGVYYEKIYGIKSYLKSPTIFAKYHRHNVTIVHELGPDQLHSLIAILLSRLLRRPLIVTLTAYRYDELRSLNKSTIGNLFPVLFEQLAMILAIVVIVPSEWQKRRLPAAIRRKTVVVYPGTSMPGEARSVDKRKKGAVSITGSLSGHDRIDRKGVDVIAEIAELTPQLTFHIIGGSIDQLDSLRRIPTNLEFHGLMTEREVQNLLSKAKFVLAPSRHEAFSISVLEGMRCGCIGVVSEFCGIQDMVRTCGRVLPLNASVFSRSILKLLENEKQADKIRIKGQKVSYRFTWERTAEELGRIYDKLAREDPHSKLGRDFWPERR